LSLAICKIFTKTKIRFYFVIFQVYTFGRGHLNCETKSSKPFTRPG